MNASIAVSDEFTEELESELLEFMATVSTVSSFYAAIWFFDKLKRSAGHSDGDYKVYFAGIPEIYIEVVRYWVLLRIRNGKAVRTVSISVAMLKPFLHFLINECGAPALSNVNRLTIEAYEEHVRMLRDVSMSSKEQMWTALAGLFKVMRSWPKMPPKSPIANGNPFYRRELDRKSSHRLIPDMVLEQLDATYRDTRLALEDRLLYWILRSIPSRIGEVTSIELECLRTYRDGFILTMPEFKSAGNQLLPTKKLIHIKNEGHGKFLLDLVREQQEVARLAQGKLPEKSRGYLMVSPEKRVLTSLLRDFKNPRGKRISAPFILVQGLVRKRMKRIMKAFNVCDKNGKLFNIIPHAFRHNGITERLYEGFSYIEIRDMSGHRGNQMLTSYAHTKDSEIVAIANKKREAGEVGPPVHFKGRIMNLTPEKEQTLLQNPRAYRIGDLGICSDVTSCGGDLFECLDCDYLVPDADNEEYYVKECTLWTERTGKHLKNNNRSLAEQAHYMANLYQKQLDRIKLGVLMAKPKETSDVN